MIRLTKKSLTSWCSWLVGFALVVGLSGPALAQGLVNPPPTGPVDDMQTTLGIILDRLDDIEDALPESLGPCDVPPVWGKKIGGADRFVEVLDGGAYCDQETGLVWEQSPDIEGGPNNDGERTWASAISHCASLEVDDRKGWTLPMREQLATLVDTTSQSCANDNICLPDGHPFSDVGSASYWSATSNVGFGLFDVWFVRFYDGAVTDNIELFTGGRAWCVRGGQVYDGQDVQEVIDALPAP